MHTITQLATACLLLLAAASPAAADTVLSLIHI